MKTPFHDKVYTIVKKIPRGKVATYGQVALLLGNFRASRAVGNAMHKCTDPQIPWHRVMSATGHLIPGMEEKHRKRLESEGITVRKDGTVDLARYGWDMRIPYRSLSNYLKETFGGKVYKIAIDGGFTCPNRDGTIATGGCSFCSAGGSGDFAQDRRLSVTEQIVAGQKTVERKMPEGRHRYIAYFQAFTNTYGPVDKLERIYCEALSHPDVVAISLGTRPDCVDEAVVSLLCRLREEYRKPIWVELGLQTIHEKTAQRIRRGYPLLVYDHAVRLLGQKNIPVITHVILGLPGETIADMLDTVDYVAHGGISGIKLQLLHVLEGTDLAKEYAAGEFSVLTEEEYCLIVRSCLAILPKEIIVHRITGDGDKKTLIAPLWSANKRQVLNHFARLLFPE